jgi:predicted dehydrogenase
VNVVIIGPGKMGQAHAKALKQTACALTAVMPSSSDSKSLSSFLELFPGTPVLNNIDDVISNAATWDAVYICCPTKFTTFYLQKLAPLNKLIFAEKPVATETKEFITVAGESNIFVGYNRRHYENISKFRELIQQHPPTLVSVVIPESSALGQHENKILPQLVYENSAHVFDLLSYLFGLVSWQHGIEYRDENGTVESITVLGVVGEQMFVPINLSMCFDSADNFSITATNKAYRFQLKPLEILTVYSGMEVVEPSPESPIRSYQPIEVGKYFAESAAGLKPGFLEQARELKDTFDGRKRQRIGASMEDAAKAIGSIESLVSKLRSGNVSRT